MIFEIHFGPKDEFAWFKTKEDKYADHREHDSPLNLLTGGYTVNYPSGKKTVTFDKYTLEISAGGTTREECTSYFVTFIRRIK